MSKKTILIKQSFLLAILSLPFLFSPVLAVGLKDAFDVSYEASNLYRFKSLALYGHSQTPEYYVGLLLTGLFSILGIIAIALLIYSGFTWMTARGNESKVEKAKENLYNVIIGLIFIMGGYALTAFLLNIFK